jgi:hypothetical protein
MSACGAHRVRAAAVLGDERVSVMASVVPDIGIVGFVQIEKQNV